MSRHPDIDFARIRPHGRPASRDAGFEELASILISHGVVEWPEGMKFERFGNPDGGREGRGILPDGTVWAWQAKYVFEFDAGAAGQVTSSVHRVLDTEPRLRRFLVVFPFDLPAGDTADRTSAHTRWSSKVAEWEAAAEERGRTIEFVFVGAHELITALTEAQHAGRARYWFDSDVLSPERQSRDLEQTLAKANRRYSPQLHVEVDAVQALEGLGRTGEHIHRWQGRLAQLREATRWGWRPPEEEGERFLEPLERCARALAAADEALAAMIDALRGTAALPDVEHRLEEGLARVEGIDSLLHEHALQPGGYFAGEAASLYSNVKQAGSSLWQAIGLARGAAAADARAKNPPITRRAGAGKTHLLCEVAERRLAGGRPTLLLLGQDFDVRAPLSQVPTLARLGDDIHELLAVFDAASEAAGCVGLLLIDALNESAHPGAWRDELEALHSAAARYPNVGLGVACRTEFVDRVIGERIEPRMEHHGFAEATDAAIERFTREFGIETPTFPVLNPEFSNPLFLKLTCEALATLGEARFPLGSAGLTTICDAFLDAVNERLSDPDRCDFDPRTRLVQSVVRELVLRGEGPLDRTDCRQVADRALPGRTWSRSLMQGLLTEGVLLDTADDKVTFGYQRLGDVLRATAIAEPGIASVQEWLAGLEDQLWRRQGVLGALAVIVPERHRVELIDLAADDQGRVHGKLVDAFVESLVLRSATSTSDRTLKLVLRLLDHEHYCDAVLDRLLRLACVPAHPLNARWLHRYLAELGLTERDASWSQWLVGAVEDDEETAVRRLIAWSWPPVGSRPRAVPDEVAELAGTALGWFLTTTDRRVRDRATKALVSVGDAAPSALSSVLAAFRDVDDPYVLDRLAAAACGVALRTDDPEAIIGIADGLRELIGGSPPEHLLVRDYARRVFSAARGVGWDGPAAEPPYGADWPVETRSFEDIETLCAPPEHAYSSIWHSVTGFGDFGRYELQPALRNIAVDDARELQHRTERAIFDRVLELGWSPRRFGNVDRGRSGHVPLVERVGKKYQWIGLYETLGRIADQHPVKPDWGTSSEQPYTHAEQLVWRDIDPTVLARKPPSEPGEAQMRRWFSPEGAEFPAGVTHDYPADMDGVPDPLDLIAVTDDDGVPWLVLLGCPEWRQPHPPEEQALRVPRLVVWMHLRAYLIRAQDANTVSQWAAGKDWFGRWMPESPDVHNALLGAHPGDPQWAAASGESEWWGQRNGPQPCALWDCGAWYGGTGTSRDASAQDETRGYVPSMRLRTLLGLGRGTDFRWHGPSGVAVQDPAVSTGGPASLLMRRDTIEQLADSDLTLFWTVLIGKELRQEDSMPPGDKYRWVSASASYLMGLNGIRQIGAAAKRCRPGPATENMLTWPTREEE
jgi:hypothetical protein